MQNHYFKNKSRLLFVLITISIASLAVRVLFEYRFHETALLYVGIPLCIAVTLILVRSPCEASSWEKRYVNRIIDAFIIMFGSSVVLFEGFVCVVMFMPIYLVAILTLFVIQLAREQARKRERNTLGLHVLPLLIFLSAFEGVFPQFSFERNESVTVSRVVYASVDEIRHNLRQPMDLQTSRPWFLYLFPMPHKIQAGTLNAGDIHKIHFRYYRWFITNLHEGEMLLQLSKVTNNTIKTRFVKDSSYFSNYLHLKGSEINLYEVDDNTTRITLRIDYERNLDPYWYFSPLTRYGIHKTAEFLITEVIARDAR